MTIRKVLWKENVKHPSVNDRRLIHQLWGGREGPMGHPDFGVIVASIVGMNYNINVGRLVAKNQLTDGLDFYFVENDAPFPVTHNPGNGSNPRNDLVCLKISDSFLTGGSDADTIVVLEGNPAINPVDPVLPTDATYCPLYSVRVGTNATALSLSNFTLKRLPPTTLANTPIWVANAADRDTRVTPFVLKGMQVWRDDFSYVETWLGSGWGVTIRANPEGDAVIPRDLQVVRSLSVAGSIAGPTISSLSTLIGGGGVRAYPGDLNFVPLSSTPGGVWLCGTNANASYGVLLSVNVEGAPAVQFAVTYGVGDSNSPYWAYVSARTFSASNPGVWGPWWRCA